MFIDILAHPELNKYDLSTLRKGMTRPVSSSQLKTPCLE